MTSLPRRHVLGLAAGTAAAAIPSIAGREGAPGRTVTRVTARDHTWYRGVR
jgi:hypothetical protein